MCVRSDNWLKHKTGLLVTLLYQTKKGQYMLYKHGACVRRCACLPSFFHAAQHGVRPSCVFARFLA